MATREEIELVRERVDMVELLSRYIKLKPSGSRYVALCPFHPDKHPSLVVDPEKKLFHCFGCGAGGDVFHFLMRIENLSFGEAVARLAREVGVELSRPEATKQDRLWELNERVARYFQRNLASPAGAAARRYLQQERGLKPETIKRFRLGYALPGWDNLVKTFPDPEALLRLGLVLRGREGSFYDRFRDRVIFPLADHRGRVIGFAGRIIRAQEQEEPKYLNIPNTPLFAKGQALYGLHLAREAQPEEFILVEGYLDVITAHQAGFTNAIATMGTALTEYQARLLRRYVERVVLVYDRDAAGQQAALRGMRALRNAGLDVRVALLPVGEDPDSLIRSRGAEAFRRALRNALPFHKFYLELFAEVDRHDPLQVERALREAASFVREISSRPLRYELIRGLAEIFDLPEEEVELELKRAAAKARPVPQREKRLDGRPWGAEEHLLHFLLRGDLSPERALRELDPADFQRYRGIIEEIFDQIRTTGMVRPEALLERLSAEEASIVTALALAEVEFRDREKALDDALNQLRLRRCQRELQELRARLRQAEASGAAAEAQRLLEESRRKQAELLRLLRGQNGKGKEERGR